LLGSAPNGAARNQILLTFCPSCEIRLVLVLVLVLVRG
jgi:hypothetical protein